MQTVQQLASKRVCRLWQQRDDPSVSPLLDFEFVVVDKWTRKEARLRVSRALVSVTCDALSQIITSSIEVSETAQVLIEDCTIEGFGLFVGCLHGVDPEIYASNVTSLLRVADKYCDKEVAEMCREWIREFVDDCDVASFTFLMDSLRRDVASDSTVKKCMEQVSEKGSLLFESSFYLLPVEIVASMLKNACFEKKTEEEVFERCVQWSKRQFAAVHSLDDEIKVDESTLRLVLASKSWTAPMQPLIALIRFPLMSAAFLYENRPLLKEVIGSETLTDVLYQKTGYGSVFCGFPRKRVFDLFSDDCIFRVPMRKIASKLSVTAKKRYSFVCTEIKFDDCVTAEAVVRFCFEVVVCNRGSKWIQLGVAADISQLLESESILDDSGADWRYANDCWMIGSATDKPMKNGRCLAEGRNRAKARKWNVTGSVLKVELSYHRSDRRVNFKAFLKGDDFNLIYDFDIEDWTNESCFYPFICLAFKCKCDVTVL